MYVPVDQQHVALVGYPVSPSPPTHLGTLVVLVHIHVGHTVLGGWVLAAQDLAQCRVVLRIKQRRRS
jgi:hypothetical protein